MRVIRSTYRGAAEWRAQRHAVQEARSTDRGKPPLEPAVVVSGPEEHTQGSGILIEAVGPDGAAVYQRLLLAEGRAPARLDEAIEVAIQEAWRQLVRHVGPTDERGT